jgi:two-component system response regulator YesN
MDIRMPGLDGIEASKIIKKFLPDVKIIFLTAFNEFDYAKEAIGLRAEDYIIKPASNQRLIDSITNVIKKIEANEMKDQQRKDMEEKLKTAEDYLKMRFLFSIADGELSGKEAREYLSFIKNDFETGFAFVISLNYDKENVNSLSMEYNKKQISDQLREKFKLLHLDFMIGVKKDFIYVLVLCSDEIQAFPAQDHLKKVIIDSADSIAEETGIYLDFGIGKIYSNPNELWKSFSKAKMDCQKSVTDQKSLLLYDRIDRLARMIADKESDEIKTYSIDFFDLVFDENLPIDSLKIKLFEILIMLEQSLVQLISYPLSFSHNKYESLMQINTYYECKIFFKDYIENIKQKLTIESKDKNSVIIDKLITYINGHYNENISLDDLVDVCGLSSSYLSKLFKEKLNMNFIDYLTMVRLKVAKRLLRSPYNSIKDISNQIGYYDPNYFTRVFKKHEHITPTEYRAKHTKQE